jgi:hypothetical protein
MDSAAADGTAAASEAAGSSAAVVASFNVTAIAERRQLDVKEIHARAVAKLATLAGTELKPKHAALFFESVEKKEGTAQQQKGTCMACDTPVVSTGSFKFHSHILSCPLMALRVKKAFKVLRDESSAKTAGKREAQLLQKEEAQIAAQQHNAEQAKLKQMCIRAGIHNSEVDAADKAIANFFYANAIPFSAADFCTSHPFAAILFLDLRAYQ